MDRFERFNEWFNGALARTFPIVTLLLAVGITAFQLPIVLSVLAVGAAATLVYLVRHRINDVLIVSSVYALVVSMVQLSRR